MSLSNEAADAIDAVSRGVTVRFDGAAALLRPLWREGDPSAHDDRLSMRLEMPLRRLRVDRSSLGDVAGALGVSSSAI